VDVRLIASTHQDLKALVQAGKFRQDLYFRLNVIAIHLPPLRQRREDILPLAEHFLQRYCQGQGVPALALETRRLLLDYSWPGNVRELEHEMERVVTLNEPGQEISPELLSEDLRGHVITSLLQQGAQGEKLKELVVQLERQLIEETLEKNQGNHTRTAEQLGLSRQGLLKKMHRYGIS
jgi:transcriptional regulator with PAS, ATPase and Fis domain